MTRKRPDKPDKATKKWQVAAIKAGVREANRGHFIDHGELKAKWKKKLAAAMDTAR